jgi:biotin carboxyl carrier protein
MNYKIKINGIEYEVHIRKVEDKKAFLTVNNEDFEVEVDGLIVNPASSSSKSTLQKPIQAIMPVVKPTSPKFNSEVRPPLPGVILDICVNEGDTVKKGQVLYVLEAMKMENNIESDFDGVVEKICRAKGEPVLENDVILVIK